MKAAIVERPGMLVIKDVPEPEVGEDDILVKVRTASICNATDNDIFWGTFEGFHDFYPQILGHEVHGEVVDCGSQVKGLQKGERVVFYTQHGAFCEYTKVDASRPLWARIPPELTDAESSLCEMFHGSLLGTVYPSGLKNGEKVVVVGQGPMGLVTSQCVKALADVTLGVVDLFDLRLAKAREIGADFVYDRSQYSSAEIADQIGKDLGPVDLVILCTSVDLSGDVFDFAVRVLKRNGRLTGLNVDVKGVPHYVNVMALFHKNILLRRSLMPDAYPEDPEARASKQLEVFQMGVDWVRDGKVNLKTLVTHELPLREVESGLRLCRDRPEETIKVVIHI